MKVYRKRVDTFEFEPIRPKCRFSIEMDARELYKFTVRP